MMDADAYNPFQLANSAPDDEAPTASLVDSGHGQQQPPPRSPRRHIAAIFLGLGIMAGLALVMGRLGGSGGRRSDQPLGPPSLEAAAVMAAQPQGLSAHLCNIEHVRMDPACPRYTHLMYLKKERLAYSGLGDRFLQMLVGFAYAIDLNAPLLNVLPELESPSEHGDYGSVNDFFRLDVNLVNMTFEEATRTMPEIEIPNEVNKTTLYEQKIAALQDQCNVVISVNPAHDCSWVGDQHACYAALGPALYEKASNVLACGFLHTDRSKLSKLRFDLDSYNVVIHLRVGDMVLHGANAFSNPFLQRYPALHGHNASGFAYCSTMKRELDQVLSEFDRIHYIFIDEEPEAGEAGPPQELAFLSQIFRSEDEGGRSVRVSYLNDLDPRESLYHMMNGDMLISPGSSFPAIAATLSSKPVVLLSKPYVGRTFPASQDRPDYAHLENDGSIVRPSIVELQARVAIRYMEVHDKLVPYGDAL